MDYFPEYDINADKFDIDKELCRICLECKKPHCRGLSCATYTSKKQQLKRIERKLNKRKRI